LPLGHNSNTDLPNLFDKAILEALLLLLPPMLLGRTRIRVHDIPLSLKACLSPSRRLRKTPIEFL
jgi:hypothetical protein